MDLTKKLHVIKYSNEIQDLNLGNFLKNELKVGFLIILKARSNGTGIFKLGFYDLKKTLGKNYTDKEIINLFNSVKQKLLEQHFMVQIKDKIYDFNILSYIARDVNDPRYIIVKINPDFLPLFNNIVENYSTLDGWDIEKFKSKYSILLYKLLLEFRTAKDRFLEGDDFKNRFGISDKTTAYVNDKVLALAKKEVKKLVEFKDLKVEKTVDKKSHKLKTIRFKG